MKILWKGFVEEQIWYGIKTEKAHSESHLHYSELPLNEIYETEDFGSAYAFLENHETSAQQDTGLLRGYPLITFSTHCPWPGIALVDEQRFKKYHYVANYAKIPISNYSLMDLQCKLPAMEFIDFLKDNFENPLDKLSNL